MPIPRCIAPDAESWQRRGHLFVVCDGMGAHAAGELASKMAADSIPHTYLKLRDRSPVEALRKSIEVANNQIHTRGENNADFQGMGTTASALVLLPQGAVVGACRRQSRLPAARKPLGTVDIRSQPRVGNVGRRTRAQGRAAGVRAEKHYYPFAGASCRCEDRSWKARSNWQLVDTFLLCSDGLTGQVQDEEIGALLQCLTPAETAQVLVDLANLRGGPDNITIVIARWKNGTATGRNSSDAHAPGAGTPQTPSHSKAKFASPLMLAALACVIVAVGFGAAQATIPTFVALGIGIALALIGWLQQSVQTLQPVSTFVSGGHLEKGLIPRLIASPAKNSPTICSP